MRARQTAETLTLKRAAMGTPVGAGGRRRADHGQGPGDAVKVVLDGSLPLLLGEAEPGGDRDRSLDRDDGRRRPRRLCVRPRVRRGGGVRARGACPAAGLGAAQGALCGARLFKTTPRRSIPTSVTRCGVWSIASPPSREVSSAWASPVSIPWARLSTPEPTRGLGGAWSWARGPAEAFRNPRAPGRLEAAISWARRLLLAICALIASQPARSHMFSGAADGRRAHRAEAPPPRRPPMRRESVNRSAGPV